MCLKEPQVLLKVFENNCDRRFFDSETLKKTGAPWLSKDSNNHTTTGRHTLYICMYVCMYITCTHSNG